MHFERGNIYHLYNRGNNSQNIFFDHENYVFFLNKVRNYLRPLTEILCYCLMPNHFHLLIYTPELRYSIDEPESSNEYSKNISKAIAIILRSYTQAINKKHNRTGSLFQQKTKAKNCNTKDSNYPFTCFHYIHQNPLISELVSNLSDWKYSSYPDYIGERSGTLISRSLSRDLLDVPLEIKKFKEQSKSVSTINFKP